MVTLPISSNLGVGCDRVVLVSITIRHNYGGPGSQYQGPSAHQGPNFALQPLPVLSLYFDDTSVIVTFDLAIIAIFEVYGCFEKGCGSKLNLGKCEGLWLGSWRDQVEGPVAINWTSSKIKVLGIFIGNISMEEANWLPRIEAVRNCLKSWRHRALSFKGKTLVLNALALSKIWYVGLLVVMPP